MEDVTIIELFFSRSEQAIGELSAKYGKLLNRIARNILNCAQDAEECENDTYLKAWNSIPPTRPAVLSAYVSRITRNLAINRLQYYSRKKRSRQMEVLFCELEDCIPGTADVEAAADDTVSNAINMFLEKLEPQTRILFIHRYFFMESVAALAVRFSLKESTVSTKLNRTRSRLKKHLEEEGIAL